MKVFFQPADYERYRRELARQAVRHELSVWVYCLMPNHVHLVAVPDHGNGLSSPIGEAHRRYAVAVNRRHGWKGHLWQARFGSFPMDETHLLFAARYVLLNPVRAGLARTAADWPYSSARAHLGLAGDDLVNTAPLEQRVADWEGFLHGRRANAEELIRKHSRTGRPLGSKAFVRRLEEELGRRLRARRPGRPPSRQEGLR